MILPLPWVFAGIGVVMMATSVPLMLRRVPMNRWYGVRTRKAYASEEAWYEINAFGGRAFFLFGLLLVAVAWFGRDVLPDPRDPLAALAIGLPAVALLAVLLALNRFSRRFPGA
jgi:hypothetical protein